MGHPWVAHRFLILAHWSVIALSGVPILLAHGLIGLAIGSSMGTEWRQWLHTTAHGPPMGRPWVSHRVAVLAHGSSMAL